MEKIQKWRGMSSVNHFSLQFSVFSCLLLSEYRNIYFRALVSKVQKCIMELKLGKIVSEFGNQVLSRKMSDNDFSDF